MSTAGRVVAVIPSGPIARPHELDGDVEAAPHAPGLTTPASTGRHHLTGLELEDSNEAQAATDTGSCRGPCRRSGWSERHRQPLDAADEVRAQLLRLGRGLNVRQSAEQLDKHRRDLASRQM